MKMQEAFNKVVMAMRKQGKPSVSEGQCRYSSDGGLHCAIGIFLSREALELIEENCLEGHGIADLLDYPLLQDELTLDTDGNGRYYSQEFWDMMQNAHDANFQSVRDVWKSRMEQLWEGIAEKWTLTIPS